MSGEKWICRRPQICGRLAKKFGSDVAKVEAMIGAMNTGWDIQYPGLHVQNQIRERGIPVHAVDRVIRALNPEFDDMRVFSEVIDYCRASGNVLVHGIIQDHAGHQPRHLHVVVGLDRSGLVVKTAYDPADEAEIWDADFRKRLCFCPKKQRREFYRTVDRDVW